MQIRTLSNLTAYLSICESKNQAKNIEAIKTQKSTRPPIYLLDLLE